MKKIMSSICWIAFAAALSFCTKPNAEQGRGSQNPAKPDPYPATGTWEDSTQNADTTSNQSDTTRGNNRVQN